MTRRATILFAVSAPGAAALLVWALAGLPDFGSQVPALGDRLLDFIVREFNGTNAVGDVTYGLRGTDTMVEEFILFAAASGLVMLLREWPSEEESEQPAADVSGRRAPDTTDAVRVGGFLVAGLTVLVGLFMVAYGLLTPGGGFQGGVVLASALFTVFLSSEYATMRRVRPGALVEAAEAAGAAGLVVLALGGLLFASQFFENYLPRGDFAHILAGGLALPVNYASGLAVAGGFTVIVSEFLRQAVLVRGEGTG